MKKYKALITKILKENNLTSNRTSTPTYNTFGGQIIFNLSKGFPILTTKEVNFHAIIVELLWFIKGDTNIKFLLLNNTNIWNEWAYKKYLRLNKSGNKQLSEKDFLFEIINNDEFAKLYGNLGPIYGKQWRNFNNVDQLKEAIELIKNNPSSRRIIVSSWNPSEIKKMELPPCHCFFQFQVSKNKLNLHLYQRSADLFLGVPFNISSYSLLLHLVAQVCNKKVGKFIHSFGDLHIYQDHLEQSKVILKREIYKLPKIYINKKIKNIEDFSIEDIKLKNYKHHPKLKGKVAV